MHSVSSGMARVYRGKICRWRTLWNITCTGSTDDLILEKSFTDFTFYGLSFKSVLVKCVYIGIIQVGTESTAVVGLEH